MIKRVLTSLVGIPLLIAIVALGGVVLQTVIAVLIILGMWEIYKALSGKIMPVHFLGFLFAAIYMAYINSVRVMDNFGITSMVFVMCTMIMLVVQHRKMNVMDCCVAIFGFFYVCIPLSTAYLVRMEPRGVFTVWIIFLSAWGSDTGAYFTGITMGRHKLIPTLSPNKTVEGAVGGVVLAAAISMLYGFILNMLGVFTRDIVLQFGVIGLGGAVLSQFGDLSASAIKRHTNIKDFGHILPGHGGIIDRFDSILFTAPAVYLLSLLVSFILRK